MTGPQLETKGEGLHTQGMAPKRLKGWLSTLPVDMQTIINWVIQNFLALDGSNSGSSGGVGKITVTVEDASGYAPGAGVMSVGNVDTLTFDQDNFEIYDGGGGQCVVKLKTCPATCP